MYWICRRDVLILRRLRQVKRDKMSNARVRGDRDGGGEVNQASSMVNDRWWLEETGASWSVQPCGKMMRRAKNLRVRQSLIGNTYVALIKCGITTLLQCHTRGISSRIGDRDSDLCFFLDIG